MSNKCGLNKKLFLTIVKGTKNIAEELKKQLPSEESTIDPNQILKNFYDSKIKGKKIEQNPSQVFVIFKALPIAIKALMTFQKTDVGLYVNGPKLAKLIKEFNNDDVVQKYINSLINKTESADNIQNDVVEQKKEELKVKVEENESKPSKFKPIKEVNVSSSLARPRTIFINSFSETKYVNKKPTLDKKPSQSFYYNFLRELGLKGLFKNIDRLESIRIGNNKGFKLGITSIKNIPSDKLNEEHAEFYKKAIEAKTDKSDESLIERFDDGVVLVITDLKGNIIYFDENYNKVSKENGKPIYFNLKKPYKKGSSYSLYGEDVPSIDVLAKELSGLTANQYKKLPNSTKQKYINSATALLQYEAYELDKIREYLKSNPNQIIEVKAKNLVEGFFKYFTNPNQYTDLSEVNWEKSDIKFNPFFTHTDILDENGNVSVMKFNWYLEYGKAKFKLISKTLNENDIDLFTKIISNESLGISSKERYEILKSLIYSKDLLFINDGEVLKVKDRNTNKTLDLSNEEDINLIKKYLKSAIHRLPKPKTNVPISNQEVKTYFIEDNKLKSNIVSLENYLLENTKVNLETDSNKALVAPNTHFIYSVPKETKKKLGIPNLHSYNNIVVSDEKLTKNNKEVIVNIAGNKYFITTEKALKPIAPIAKSELQKKINKSKLENLKTDSSGFTPPALEKQKITKTEIEGKSYSVLPNNEVVDEKGNTPDVEPNQLKDKAIDSKVKNEGAANDIKKKVSKKVKSENIKKRKRNLDSARFNSIEATNKQINEAKKWWDSNPISKYVGFEEMFNVVNSNAWGTFVDSTIKLYNGSNYTVLYHEAFHAFSQLFLTQDEKIELYKELSNSKEGSKKIDEELKRRGLKKENLKDIDLYYHVAEEVLAEEFRKFMMSDGKEFFGKTEKAKSIFQKILDFLKELFGLPVSNKFEYSDLTKINQIYEKLRVGNVKEYRPSELNAMFGTLNMAITSVGNNEEKILNPVESLTVSETIDNLFIKYLEEDVEEYGRAAILELFTSPKVIYEFYERAYSDLVDEYNDLVDKYDEIYESDDDVKKAELLNKINILDAVIDNFGNSSEGVVSYHLENSKLLKYINVSYVEDKYFVKEDDTSLLHHIREGNEYKSIDLAKEHIRFIFNTLRSDELNSLGHPYLIPESSVINVLRKIFNSIDIKHPDLIIEKINEEIDEYPWLEELLERLGDPNENSLAVQQIWSGFINTFDTVKWSLAEMIIDLDEEGNVKSKVGQSSSVIKQIIRDWSNYFQTVKNSKYIKLDKNTNTNYLDYSVLDNYDKQDLKDNPYKMLNFLNDIGIPIVNSQKAEQLLYEKVKLGFNLTYVYENLEKLKKANYVINDIVSALTEDKKLEVNGKTIYIDSQNGVFRNLAEIELDLNPAYSDHMVFNASGELQNEQTRMSSLAAMQEAINSVQSYDELIALPHMKHLSYENNPAIIYNPLMRSLFFYDKNTKTFGQKRSNLIIKNTSGIKVLDKNGLIDDKSSKTSKLDNISKIVYDVNITIQNSLFSTPNHGDKGTILSIMPERLINLNNVSTTSRFYINPSDVATTDDYLQQVTNVVDMITRAEIENFKLTEKEDLAKIPGYTIDSKKQKATLTKLKFLEEIVQDEELKNKIVKAGGILNLEENDYNKVKDFISQWLKKEIRDLINLSEYGIAITDESRAIIKKYLNDKNISDKQVDNIAIRTYYINTLLHFFALSNMFYGNIDFFNVKKEEFTKRISAIASTGTRLRTDEYMVQFINNRGYGFAEKMGIERKYNNKFNSAVMEEATVHSVYVTDENGEFDPNAEYSSYIINNLIKRKGISKEEAIEEAKVILDAYINMDESDAQGYITLDAYRIMNIALNNWTLEKEKLYNKILNNEDIYPEDVKKYFQPIKMQYYGPLDTNVFAVAFHKFSLLPLMPIEGTNMEVLHNKMIEQGIDYTLFKSGSKMLHISNGKDLNGDKVYSDIKNKNLNTEVQFTPNIVYAHYLKEQLPINDKFKGSNIFSTQMRKLIENGSIANGVPVDFLPSKNKDERLEEWNKLNEEQKFEASPVYRNLIKYEKAIDNLIQYRKKQLKEEVSTDGEVNIKKLIGLIKREFSRRNVPEHITNNIDYDNVRNSLIYDLSFFPTSSSIEKALLAIVNNRLITQKVKGEPLVQAGNTFLEATNPTERDYEKWSAKELKSYRFDKEKNEVLPMEVKVTIQGDFYKLFDLKHADGKKIGIYDEIEETDEETGNTYTVKKLNITKSLKRLNETIRDEEWLSNKNNKRAITLVGVRIPVQDVNSMEYMIIKEFLPPQAGNIIVPPSEIVAKAGSDFDIDKMNVLMPHINIIDGELYYGNSKILETVEKESNEGDIKPNLNVIKEYIKNSESKLGPNVKLVSTKEIFESNPDLANGVYETLGFGQEVDLPTSDEIINIYAGTNENSDLSNFAIRPFTINVETPSGEKQYTFQSVEQGFHFHKALIANNLQVAKQILATTNGGQLKRLTNRRNLKMTPEQVKEWDDKSKSIMLNLMYESYAQNPKAAEKLLATGNAKITHTQDNTRWKTDFPEVVMTVRDMLRKEGFGTQSQITPKDNKNVITAFRVNNNLGLLESLKKYNAIGNPIRWEGKKPGEATKEFLDWIFDENTTIEPEYRKALIEAFKSGRLKGKPILYYKSPKTEQMAEDNIPSHASVLDYLINEYDWNNNTSENNIDKNEKNISIKEFTNHSGGAYGADTMWDIIGREFGTTNHRYYIDADNTSLSQKLRNNKVQATVLTPEQMEIARAEVEKLLGKKFPNTTQGNLQVRNYYQVANADAVYAIATLNSDKTGVSGDTNTAVQLGIKMGKPVYVWDINTEQWYKFDSSKKYESLKDYAYKTLFRFIDTKQVLRKDDVEYFNDRVDDLIAGRLKYAMFASEDLNNKQYLPFINKLKENGFIQVKGMEHIFSKNGINPKEQFEKENSGIFTPTETPTLTKNFAGVGTRDIENYSTLDKTTNEWTPRKEYVGDEKAQKAQQAIRDVYEKTFNSQENNTPRISIDKEKTFALNIRSKKEILSDIKKTKSEYINTKKEKQNELDKLFEGKEDIEAIKPKIKALKKLKTKRNKLDKEYNFKLKRVEILDSYEVLTNPQLEEYNELVDIVNNLADQLDDLDEQIDELQSFISNNIVSKEDIKAIKEKYDNKLDELKTKLTDLNKELIDVSDAAVENHLLENMIDIFKMPHMFEKFITPNSISYFEPGIKKYSNDALYDVKETAFGKMDRTSYTKFLSPAYNIFKHYGNSQGKETLGYAAIANTFAVIFKRIGAYLNIDPNTIPFDVNTINKNNELLLSISDEYNKAGASISEIIGQLINGYVDVAKDPWVLNLMLVKEILPVVDFMLISGIDHNKVLEFINNPTIKNVYKKLKFINSPVYNLYHKENYNRNDVLSKELRRLTGNKFIKLNMFGKQFIDFDSIKLYLKDKNLGNIKDLSKYDNEEDIFLTFLLLDNYSKPLSNLKGVYNFDTSKINSLYFYQEKTNKISELKSNEYLPIEVINKLDESLLGSFNIGDFQNELWLNLFKIRNNKKLNSDLTNIFSDFKLRKEISKFTSNTEHAIELIKNQMISPMLKASLISMQNFSMSNSDIKELSSNFNKPSFKYDGITFRNIFKTSDELLLAVDKYKKLKNTYPFEMVSKSKLFEARKKLIQSLSKLEGKELDTITWKVILRDMALNNTFINDKLFKDNRNFSSEFLEIFNTYDELNKLLLFNNISTETFYSFKDKNKTKPFYTLKLKNSNLTKEEQEAIAYELKRLENPSDSIYSNLSEFDRQYLSNYFKLFSIVSVLRSGVSSSKTKTLNSIINIDNVLNALNENTKALEILSNSDWIYKFMNEFIKTNKDYTKIDRYNNYDYKTPLNYILEYKNTTEESDDDILNCK